VVRHDASVETSPNTAAGRAGRVAELQSVLSTLAYGLTRSSVHERLVAAAGVPLDRPGLAVLRVLDRASTPLRVGELADRLGVRHPHVTRQIRQLEAQGLVERVLDEDDRRGRRIAPTRRGLEASRRVAEETQARLSESLADVPPEDITVAVEVLRRINAGLGLGTAGQAD
jgi:DNA-binding MarR family transcriptional regulator